MVIVEGCRAVLLTPDFIRRRFLFNIDQGMIGLGKVENLPLAFLPETEKKYEKISGQGQKNY